MIDHRVVFLLRYVLVPGTGIAPVDFATVFDGAHIRQAGGGHTPDVLAILQPLNIPVVAGQLRAVVLFGGTSCEERQRRGHDDDTAVNGIEVVEAGLVFTRLRVFDTPTYNFVSHAVHILDHHIRVRKRHYQRVSDAEGELPPLVTGNIVFSPFRNLPIVVIFHDVDSVDVVERDRGAVIDLFETIGAECHLGVDRIVDFNLFILIAPQTVSDSNVIQAVGEVEQGVVALRYTGFVGGIEGGDRVVGY